MSPHEACAAQRRQSRTTLLLDGDPAYERAWGPLLAVEPDVLHAPANPASRTTASLLDDLDRLLSHRFRKGSDGTTGVALVLPYEALGTDPHRAGGSPSLADGCILLAVDRSIVWREGSGGARPAERPIPPTPATGFRTSLPREAYRRAVERVQAEIRLGNIYQANLCQRFEATWSGDPFILYRALVASTPAPRAAFLEVPGLAIVSASPEVFVDADRDGGVVTVPIKGTRPRGASPDADREAAAALLRSEKDLAELVMIVDLERNDLNRVCVPGSVAVDALPLLRSYPAVHHLVAPVRGTLRRGVRPSEWIRSVFPGGSITGAPKIRAAEILREVEPVPRGSFTGSLFWFGDDGSVRSSILIRTLEAGPWGVRIGAGGGVVADSDPEGEWREANHKARALTRVIGYEPEDAS